MNSKSLTDRRKQFLESIEMRAFEEDGNRRIIGLAIPYNQETVIAGAFREMIRSGACSKTLQESDQHAYWNHDNNCVLGRRGAGTLKLEETAEGVRFEIILPNTEDGNRAYELIKRGDVTGCSFGFQYVPGKFTRHVPKSSGELPLIEIHEMKLFEISLTSRAAYQTTEVEARSMLKTSGIIIEADGQANATTEEPDGSHSGTPEPGDAHHSAAGEAVRSSLQRQARLRELTLRSLKYGQCRTQ